MLYFCVHICVIWLLFIPLQPMKNKVLEQNNEKVFTAYNLVFRNQPDKFIPPGV